MSPRLNVTFWPHIQDSTSISSMTRSTILAAAPAILAGFYFFGLRAVLLVVISVLTAMVTEAGICKMRKKPSTIHDGTAALTGLLLAMLLPAGTPWWAMLIGSASAIILGRQIFGGYGGNPFNAVLVGWIVLQLSWKSVAAFTELTPLFDGWGKLVLLDPSELPLGLLDYGRGITDMYGLGDLLVGAVPGGIGSTSAIGLILGGIYLLSRKIIPWQIPISFLCGIFIFGLIFWLVDPNAYANPFYHLITGYTLIGAFFLAPEPTNSPFTHIGMLIFGFVAGVLTMIIRYWGANQDGVVFAIMFFNVLTPFLDRLKARSYGRAPEWDRGVSR